MPQGTQDYLKIDTGCGNHDPNRVVMLVWAAVIVSILPSPGSSLAAPRRQEPVLLGLWEEPGLSSSWKRNGRGPTTFFLPLTLL